MVLLPAAPHPPLDQHEAEVEGPGLRAGVDGVPGALADVGLPARIQGPERLRAALGRRPRVPGRQHLRHGHGDQAPQAHPALLADETRDQDCRQKGIATWPRRFLSLCQLMIVLCSDKVMIVLLPCLGMDGSCLSCSIP